MPGIHDEDHFQILVATELTKPGGAGWTARAAGDVEKGHRLIVEDLYAFLELSLNWSLNAFKYARE